MPTNISLMSKENKKQKKKNKTTKKTKAEKTWKQNVMKGKIKSNALDCKHSLLMQRFPVHSADSVKNKNVC